jgi:hypothetical protein
MPDTPEKPAEDDSKTKPQQDSESLEDAQEDAAHQREEEGGYQ